MKKIKIVFIIIGTISTLFLLLFFAGVFSIAIDCYKGKNYPPKSEWHLTTNELFVEYGQKYVDYAVNIINSYNLDCNITSELKSYNRYDEKLVSYYLIETVFADGYQLEITFGEDESRFYVKLFNNNVLFTDVYDIKYEYLEIIYKIAIFSVYDFYGDINTIPKLINEGKKENGDTLYYRRYRWLETFEKKCEYVVRSYKNYNKEDAVVEIVIKAYLTDKNIWS